MRIDSIGRLNYDTANGGQYSQNYEQTPITHVLLVSKLPLSWGDRLSLKYRHNGNISLIHDNTQAPILEAYHDIKLGAGSSVKADLFETKVNTPKYKKPFVIAVPVGHLTLGVLHQLEVTFIADKKTGASASQEIIFLAYHGKNSPDHLLQFDVTYDNDTTQDMVREIYAIATKPEGFVNAQGEYLDLRYEVKTKNHQTSNSIAEYLAVTTAFGAYEVPSVSNFALIASYPEALPERSVKIKTMGSKSCDAGLMLVKESLIRNTSESTLKQLKEAKEAIRSLEQDNAEMAKLYRHAQVIPKSAHVENSIAIIEAGKVSDQN
jgi:hypothetical protein